MPKVSRVLVVLASPTYNQDNRAGVVTKLCKKYIESCLKKGLDVDTIDLYKDKEFNALSGSEDNDTKDLEYQIKIKRSDLIAFFYPSWQGFLPGVLKTFCEKVFVSGVSYKTVKSIPKPLLANKQCQVFIATEKPLWQEKLVYKNMHNTFWKRSIFAVSGIKSQLFWFDKMRSVSNKDIENWYNKISATGWQVDAPSKIIRN